METVVLKYDDRVYEIPVGDLDMHPVEATDAEVKTAVQRHLGLDDNALAEFVVFPDQDHDQRQTITVLNLRPSAEFG